LYSDKNEKAYDENKARNLLGRNQELMQEAINWCLESHPELRPSFPFLEGESFFYMIEMFCDEETSEADMKATKYIEQNKHLINHKDSLFD